jgi:hypothetical protein
MIVNILGWLCLVASWVMPQKWFLDKVNWLRIRLALSACALGLFIGALLS